MPDENSTSWPLHCPECREYVAIELAEDLEAGRIATERCPTGHRLMFQFDGQTVEMLGALGEKD